ncbi:MAG: YgiT-type zinc finger protein [Chloroflexi bacterium]|nr:YgiT-type zinc finger protein [Chloroflexota bacterium]
MFSCTVCLADESREELVEEVFRADGKYVLVKDIPAQVCARCGEESFSAKTAESVRVMVNEQGTSDASISPDIFTFVPTD